MRETEIGDGDRDRRWRWRQRERERELFSSQGYVLNGYDVLRLSHEVVVL